MDRFTVDMVVQAIERKYSRALAMLSEYQLKEDEGFARFVQSRLQNLPVTQPE